jgi:hypothetical protein
VSNDLTRVPPEQQGRLSEAEISKLSPAARLDYSRRFDQSKMPEWKNPRRPTLPPSQA